MLHAAQGCAVAMTCTTGNAAEQSPAAATDARGAHMILAHSIGSRVPSPLPEGRVHSVYRQVCNVEAPDGTLVTLLSEEVGNLPHGVRCTLPERADFQTLLQPGQPVVADGAYLRIPAAALSVDTSNAARWYCEVASCEIDSTSQGPLALLIDLRAVLKTQGPASGFAPLLLQDTQPREALDSAMRGRLSTTLPVLERATASLDSALAAWALGRLVGLGPGLTPSGDDFIVGYLAALHVRGARELHIGHLARELGNHVRRLAEHTNAISRQFLLNAVAAEFSESLALTIRAVCRQDRAAVLRAAARTVRIGHSSGADSLIGLLFGLCPTLVLASTPPIAVAQTGEEYVTSELPTH